MNHELHDLNLEFITYGMGFRLLNELKLLILDLEEYMILYHKHEHEF